MASRDQIIQRMARIYKEEHSSADIDLQSFADWLISHGVQPPPAPTQRELMAKAAKRALKQDVRHDEVTGRPYHGWQAVPHGKDARTGQLSFTYVDADDAQREPMKKALLLKVSMMVDDGVQVTFDAEHWNRINPKEDPIEVDELLDLRDQVEWRIAARSEESTESEDDDDNDGGMNPDIPFPDSPA